MNSDLIGFILTWGILITAIVLALVLNFKNKFMQLGVICILTSLPYFICIKLKIPIYVKSGTLGGKNGELTMIGIFVAGILLCMTGYFIAKTKK